MSRIQSIEEQALEFAKQRQEWKKNPVDFFKEVLGINLPLHQKRMLQDCLNILYVMEK